MTERPEWIKCITKPAEGRGISKVSWCGRTLPMEWAFVDIEHAINNAEDQGRLVCCGDCANAVHEALTSNIEEDLT